MHNNKKQYQFKKFNRYDAEKKADNDLEEIYSESDTVFGETIYKCPELKIVDKQVVYTKNEDGQNEFYDVAEICQYKRYYSDSSTIDDHPSHAESSVYESENHGRLYKKNIVFPRFFISLKNKKSICADRTQWYWNKKQEFEERHNNIRITSTHDVESVDQNNKKISFEKGSETLLNDPNEKNLEKFLEVSKVKLSTIEKSKTKVGEKLLNFSKKLHDIAQQLFKVSKKPGLGDVAQIAMSILDEAITVAAKKPCWNQFKYQLANLLEKKYSKDKDETTCIRAYEAAFSCYEKHPKNLKVMKQFVTIQIHYIPLTPKSEQKNKYQNALHWALDWIEKSDKFNGATAAAYNTAIIFYNELLKLNQEEDLYGELILCRQRANLAYEKATIYYWNDNNYYKAISFIDSYIKVHRKYYAQNNYNNSHYISALEKYAASNYSYYCLILKKFKRGNATKNNVEIACQNAARAYNDLANKYSDYYDKSYQTSENVEHDNNLLNYCKWASELAVKYAELTDKPEDRKKAFIRTGIYQKKFQSICYYTLSHWEYITEDNRIKYTLSLYRNKTDVLYPRNNNNRNTKHSSEQKSNSHRESRTTDTNLVSQTPTHSNNNNSKRKKPSLLHQGNNNNNDIKNRDEKKLTKNQKNIHSVTSGINFPVFQSSSNNNNDTSDHYSEQKETIFSNLSNRNDTDHSTNPRPNKNTQMSNIGLFGSSVDHKNNNDNHHIDKLLQNQVVIALIKYFDCDFEFNGDKGVEVYFNNNDAQCSARNIELELNHQPLFKKEDFKRQGTCIILTHKNSIPEFIQVLQKLKDQHDDKKLNNNYQQISRGINNFVSPLPSKNNNNISNNNARQQSQPSMSSDHKHIQRKKPPLPYQRTGNQNNISSRNEEKLTKNQDNNDNNHISDNNSWQQNFPISVNNINNNNNHDSDTVESMSNQSMKDKIISLLKNNGYMSNNTVEKNEFLSDVKKYSRLISDYRYNDLIYDYEKGNDDQNKKNFYEFVAKFYEKIATCYKETDIKKVKKYYELSLRYALYSQNIRLISIIAYYGFEITEYRKNEPIIFGRGYYKTLKKSLFLFHALRTYRLLFINMEIKYSSLQRNRAMFIFIISKLVGQKVGINNTDFKNGYPDQINARLFSCMSIYQKNNMEWYNKITNNISQHTHNINCNNNLFSASNNSNTLFNNNADTTGRVPNAINRVLQNHHHRNNRDTNFISRRAPTQLSVINENDPEVININSQAFNNQLP